MTYLLEIVVRSIPTSVRKFLARGTFVVILLPFSSMVLSLILTTQSQLNFFQIFSQMLIQLVAVSMIALFFLSGVIGKPNLSNLFSASNFAFLSVSLLYAIIGGTTFGVTYHAVPRTFGGGEPVQVRLVFNNDSDLDATGLSQISELETEPVCILVELVDGLVIFDPKTLTTVVVKQDAINVIKGLSGQSIDCSPLTNRINTSTTVSPTPTP